MRKGICSKIKIFSENHPVTQISFSSVSEQIGWPRLVVKFLTKSAYVNRDLLFHWLKDHIVSRKSIGSVLLLLDGHASHCSNMAMLEYCVERKIILFSLAKLRDTIFTTPE